MVHLLCSAAYLSERSSLFDRVLVDGLLLFGAVVAAVFDAEDRRRGGDMGARGARGDWDVRVGVGAEGLGKDAD